MVATYQTGYTDKNKLLLEIHKFGLQFTACDLKSMPLHKLRTMLAHIERQGFIKRVGKKSVPGFSRELLVFQGTDQLVEFAPKIEEPEIVESSLSVWAKVYPWMFTLPKLEGTIRTHEMSDC